MTEDPPSQKHQHFLPTNCLTKITRGGRKHKHGLFAGGSNFNLAGPTIHHLLCLHFRLLFQAVLSAKPIVSSSLFSLPTLPLPPTHTHTHPTSRQRDGKAKQKRRRRRRRRKRRRRRRRAGEREELICMQMSLLLWCVRRRRRRRRECQPVPKGRFSCGRGTREEGILQVLGPNC